MRLNEDGPRQPIDSTGKVLAESDGRAEPTRCETSPNQNSGSVNEVSLPKLQKKPKVKAILSSGKDQFSKSVLETRF